MTENDKREMAASLLGWIANIGHGRFEAMAERHCIDLAEMRRLRAGLGTRGYAPISRELKRQLAIPDLRRAMARAAG